MTNDELQAANAKLQQLLERGQQHMFWQTLAEVRNGPRDANSTLLYEQFMAKERAYVWPAVQGNGNPDRSDQKWKPIAGTGADRVHAESPEAPARSIGDMLGRLGAKAARHIAGFVCNPKIWHADVKPLKRQKLGKLTMKDWHRRLKQAVNNRCKGEVMRSTLLQAGGYFAGVIQNSAEGFIQKTFEELGFYFGCKRETARKVVRWFEERGLIDTFNVLVRENHETKRAANLYALPDEPPKPGLSWDTRLADRLARYAPLFGLEPRQWGLNATSAMVGIKPATRHHSTA